jgi:nitroreductase
MDIFDVFRKRRSIRKFSPKAVSPELLEKVLEAASWAPSAHNQQPWEMVVTRDEEKKKAMAIGHRFARFLPDADVVIAVCCLLKMQKQGKDAAPGVEYFEVQDTAAAIQNMLLAAQALGLGTCWVGDFYDEEVREILAIPSEYGVMALIALGYPAEEAGEGPKRRAVTEFVHYEQF